MSDDLRDRLSDAAAKPSRDVPLGLVEQRLRGRRRRRIGATVACIALIAGGITGTAIALAGSDGPSVRTDHPTQLAAPISADGLTIDVPRGWVQELVTGTNAVPAPILVVGTAELDQTALPRVMELPQLAAPPGANVNPCLTGIDAAWSEDAFVVIAEYLPGTASPLATTAMDRPADFASAQPSASSDCSAAYVFQDHGRTFLAEFALGNPGLDGLRNEAFQILNSLRVEEAAPDLVIPTPLPTTTPPSTVPASAETEAVTAAFLGWINTQPRDAVGPYVEDFESIKSAIMEAARTAPLPVDQYTGRVDAITRIDANSADVVYSFLNAGQVAVGNLQGRAIKVDGVWKVSRDTVCASLAIGGVRCPPRGG